MKKKKTPYLDFYKKYYGKLMPDCGLCYSLSFEFGEFIESWFFSPEPLAHKPMDIFNDTPCMSSYYGYDGISKSDYLVSHEFTPLRQNMVLLLAAMNDEL